VRSNPLPFAPLPGRALPEDRGRPARNAPEPQLAPDRRHPPGTNLAGASLLTLSLLVHTNPASLVLEGFWAAIAIGGLAKAVRNRRP